MTKQKAVQPLVAAAGSRHRPAVATRNLYQHLRLFAELENGMGRKREAHGRDTKEQSHVHVCHWLDDPVMWGFKGFPTSDANLARWVLSAEDICFKNSLLSYFFRLGKCIPITRGGGIYQEHMTEALERLNDGAWLHTFPEGKVSQEDAPIRRLKWGTASLIVRAPVTPIVLPIVHQGFEEVMPENFMFGRRPPFPLCNKSINIVIGEPIEFDLPKMREKAISMSCDQSLPSRGWPTTSPCGLDEAAQRCLYSSISEQIRTVMESLRRFGTSMLNQKV
ncbi:hypothetical protein LWI29_018572 [Acer saccharum]|uniref:Tafazzin family protein n=1 Tax=Acer saccharum TaxID=4024 RepID=A0AA39VVQ7_ACESA|nr:hypothetical protein LWI29_018572 [Acer saccharum]